MRKRQHQPVPSADGVAERCRLQASELDFVLDGAELGFHTTAEVEPLEQVFGQERALRALEFGLTMRHRGYNLFVTGMGGTGRKQLLRELLEKQARREPSPEDWVYVYNFEEPDCPVALQLPSGQGVRLRTAMEAVIDRLRHDLPEVLKAKDFDAERERLATAYGQRSSALFKELEEKATQLGLELHPGPKGFVIVPLREGKAIPPEELEHLSEADKTDLQQRHAAFEENLPDFVAQQQDLTRALQQEIQEIVRAFARRVLEPLIAKLKTEHPGAGVSRWLDQVAEHMVQNLERFQQETQEEPSDLPGMIRLAGARRDPWLEYRVNVVADHSGTEGAPVIVENAPSYRNLFGTIEHDVNLFGRVSTDFMRIKPGSLLRANGGYLLFDLEDALTEPLVWKQLKRILKSDQLLTDVYEPFVLLATLALKPEPIPLHTKLVVLGSLELYYFLQFVDEEFCDLFKVRAEFGPETARDPASQRAYASFIARLCRAEKLLPFQAAAVAEVIRFGARTAEHRQKLSAELSDVADLIREAAHWAQVAGSATVQAAHVRQALEERVYRSDWLAVKLRELTQEGTLQIAVAGKCVAQINGLSVLDLGDYRFGRPCRLTASVGIGQDGLVNIERESDLSGKTHNKGVLILEGYLRNRYARQHPLSLSASLTFEQSYGWVEGDSASSTELFCLLSALAEVPLRQDIAVTGSVNQHGTIQAVGGINEKIEGFFDVCSLEGLSGTQGVCIPRSNVQNLILRPDVVEAVRAGRFHLWAIETVDEGLELLTGLPAGDLEQEGTFHHRVDQRLRSILDVLQEQPNGTQSPRVRLGQPATPQPGRPKLPGEER